jgi:hypothetical protein
MFGVYVNVLNSGMTIGVAVCAAADTGRASNAASELSTSGVSVRRIGYLSSRWAGWLRDPHGASGALGNLDRAGGALDG